MSVKCQEVSLIANMARINETFTSPGSKQVTSLDGRTLHEIDVGSTLHSVAETPEKYGSMVDDGFNSRLPVDQFIQLYE